jgi:hypothetical protein
MIQRSISLERALQRETLRFAGSLAVIVFYAGDLPPDCNGSASGERISQRKADEDTVRRLAAGTPPPMPEGASYWRLYDANGNVVMQGGADA